MSDHTKSNHPRVGVGLIIENRDGKILVGRRIGSHAPHYSILGGHLELGETFEAAATREALEETGLQIENPVFITVTNNLETFQNEGVHYISIIMHTDSFTGIPKLMEPDRCEGWQWVDPESLPEPHFEPSRIGIEEWLRQRNCQPTQMKIQA
ncbi:MAG: ADP-ribose pyrophosphatase [Candidatus Wallbacteria bacterium HGW-Wallbacteria-1]|uniref:ADP-ribose pyrophosphatase n=1 Tax=Candidatus Wallbacteria bacterium HGW-Wallbacteria-1 TaxID=2013854 RepID=A0A2N1PK74_9BACT|nr:MAG: ADP-ribose pyrophosphatase [Candidatus Wallbacteria bacterium HGW-Wallbacteria-1]